MTNSPEVDLKARSLKMGIRNFFQLEVFVFGSIPKSGNFVLYRNRVAIDSATSSDGRYFYNLASYGNYYVTFEYVENGSKSIIKSDSLKFDGFGADPNEKLTRKVAVLGVSRLAFIVEELLKLSIGAEVTFVSSNPKHVGSIFGSGVVKDFRQIDVAEFDEWILMNGITNSVKRLLESSGVRHDMLSANMTGPIDGYLNLIPIGQIHALAHKYHLQKLDVGADFLVRYIRKRFGSVLPATVDLSGARFAYGCISTVINKNAIIGKNVTIGQNVTIGGRNGLDPSIGDGVWVGAGAVVLGAKIGANSTIGANAVVTKDLPPGSVVVTPKFRELNG
ncbi:serine O-acetyltransferase [Glutamicibacter arilaitensis]|uniref:serine O-acetyltransferase n=1 Tax=Glutamicibacter arilaitensis TaxID=256701 RepID=UPI00384D916C